MIAVVVCSVSLGPASLAVSAYCSGVFLLLCILFPGEPLTRCIAALDCGDGGGGGTW